MISRLHRHFDVRNFPCNDCGKQFKRKDKLREHCIRMHTNKSEKGNGVGSASQQAAANQIMNEKNYGKSRQNDEEEKSDPTRAKDKSKFVPKVYFYPFSNITLF